MSDKAISAGMGSVERLATAALIEAARIDAEALVLEHWKANEHTMSLPAPFRLEMSREVRLAAAFLEVRATGSDLLEALKRMRAITHQHISPACDAADKAIAKAEGR